MSTRATIRFATREEGVPFDKHPQNWHAQFYNHYDGYPEGLGVEIAKSFTKYNKINGWEVEALDIVHGDIEYMYYVWQCHGKSEPWISIFHMYENTCLFVGTPDRLLKKYAPEESDLDKISKYLCDDCDCTESERDVCTN